MIQYDNATRTKIRKRIRELAPTKTRLEIAEILASEGFKTPGGKEIRRAFVDNTLFSMGVRSRKVRKRKATGATVKARTSQPRTHVDDSERSALIDLIANSKFAKQKKLELIEKLL